MKKSLISLAIISLPFGSAHAYGGDIGANGSSTGNTSSIIGDVKEGNRGISNENASGENADIIQRKIITEVGTYSAPIRITGTSGGIGMSGTSGGAGGHGGASVIGGISTGGAGGHSFQPTAEFLANGGAGGVVINNEVTLTHVTLDGIGASGGTGGLVNSTGSGSSGAGGHGGGSVFGGISTGGAAGYVSQFNPSSSSANGGVGSEVSENKIFITNAALIGANGGDAGRLSAQGGGSGSGGHGGGSVFGGVSTGGTGGYSVDTAAGGSGGNLSKNIISIAGSTLTGASGGNGGASSTAQGGGGLGAGGHGGGSVFGGISTGGSGGYSAPGNSSLSHIASGGAGGEVSWNKITIINSTLTGEASGNSGVITSQNSGGGGGAAGHGGGSVFGGISTGGAAGKAVDNGTIISYSNGGTGGNVTNNQITLTNVTLDGGGATARAGGVAQTGGSGAAGYGGGSVFGGISTGGAGGFSLSTNASNLSDGGAGGSVSGNQITLSERIALSGDIYGGISQGGAKGKLRTNSYLSEGSDGKGGLAQNNTITLIGSDITIGGSIYGGLSINGDKTTNVDADFTSYYQGNTLNLQGYRGSVRGIYNIEKFNWVLPKDVVNGDTLISISGTCPATMTCTGAGVNTGEAVKLDNTQHSVAMYDDGKLLQMGDKVTLIDKVTGKPTLNTQQQVAQGHFLLYDATLDSSNGKLTLTFGKDGIHTETSEAPARLNPTSKVFLEGRSAIAAMLNHGADMVAESGLQAARLSAANYKPSIFFATGGGSNRYKTGSHIDVRDINFALGVSNGWKFQDSKAVTLGGFVEYGQGNYDSYNYFSSAGEIHGRGNSHYTGAGVLAHMSGFGSSAGGYVNAALRAGRTKNTFDSPSMIDGSGDRGNYSSRASYFSAMVGTGYEWKFSEKQTLDFYGRYSWGKLGTDTARIGNSDLHFGATKSSRVRLGARYSQVLSNNAVPYAGLAVEREFKGNAEGVAYGMSLDQPSFKGNTGVVEVGVSLKPLAAKQALNLDMGLQGYFGKREGVSASVRVRYEF